MRTQYFNELEKIKLRFTDKHYEPNILSNTWFVETPIDAEHKYYKLMAYLQKVDKNVKKGYLYQEYLHIEKRFKDLESFLTTYEIIDEDKESKKLFNYIYDLPSMCEELLEIDNIVEHSYKLLKQKYYQLKIELVSSFDNIEIIEEQIIDKRKGINIYIMKCNSGLIEQFMVSKGGLIRYIGSFYSAVDFKNETKQNYISIKTKTAMNSVGTIIPLCFMNFKNFILESPRLTS